MVVIRLVILLFLVAYGLGMGQYSDLNGFGKLVAMSFFITGPLLYFMPTIEANLRNKKNIQSIALVNIFLGWTLVGWIIALIWAINEDAPAASPLAQGHPIESTSTRICPHCAETVKAEAKICKHCRCELTPTVTVSSEIHTPTVAVSKSMSISEIGEYKKANDMYGITLNNGKFWFNEFCYDKLSDAVNYAAKVKAA